MPNGVPASPVPGAGLAPVGADVRSDSHPTSLPEPTFTQHERKI